MYQSEFNFSGEQLKNAGMQLAVDHANAVEPSWSDRAYDFLVYQFLPYHKRFMAEEVRSYAAMADFPLPPSARAWGGVVNRAAKQFIIIKIGIKPVENPKAHQANATYWERNDERMIELDLAEVNGMRFKPKERKK